MNWRGIDWTNTAKFRQNVYLFSSNMLWAVVSLRQLVEHVKAGNMEIQNFNAHFSWNRRPMNFDAAATEIGADEFSHLLVETAQEDGAHGKRHVVTESAQKPGGLERHVRGAHHQRSSRWIRQRK